MSFHLTPVSIDAETAHRVSTWMIPVPRSEVNSLSTTDFGGVCTDNMEYLTTDRLNCIFPVTTTKENIPRFLRRQIQSRLGDIALVPPQLRDRYFFVLIGNPDAKCVVQDITAHGFANVLVITPDCATQPEDEIGCTHLPRWDFISPPSSDTSRSNSGGTQNNSGDGDATSNTGSAWGQATAASQSSSSAWGTQNNSGDGDATTNTGSAWGQATAASQSSTNAWGLAANDGWGNVAPFDYAKEGGNKTFNIGDLVQPKPEPPKKPAQKNSWHPGKNSWNPGKNRNEDLYKRISHGPGKADTFLCLLCPEGTSTECLDIKTMTRHRFLSSCP